MGLERGLSAEVERRVGADDLASALGSGGMGVLGTPALVALCEAAAYLAVAPVLEEGQSSVGTRIDLEHLAPTPPGLIVHARATLVAIQGRRLQFEIEAWDERRPVGRGTHERVVVEVARFLAGLPAPPTG